MKILCKKVRETGEETVSEVFIDDKKECFVLEDQFREVKVKGDTRIPRGTYEVKLRPFGGHHERYSKKFPDFHVGMLEITGIPNFTAVLFHIGNTDKDTEGCPLTGRRWYEENGRLKLSGSTEAYIPFYKKVALALSTGERVFVTFE